MGNSSDKSASKGRILTFYSFKGGTGRSMALANVAWILASNGKRVLVIDWDLEAPGLHRYFYPFLLDPEVTESNGLIDFFCDFVEASRLHPRRAANEAVRSDGDHWYDERADLVRYAVSLDYDFPEPGTLDFVPAGRQGPAYGIRVAAFQWADFYEELGGGVFLEIVKAKLRDEYDYILIDSRTGLSDTSGICTVQMPDELVVFFTLNRQSVFGAAAAAQSAANQRRRPTGESSLRVWPVPTRVDNAEKERLDSARKTARQTFGTLLHHIPTKNRDGYWGSVEIPYVAFYAYEEILATVADRHSLDSSMLASMIRVTREITGGAVNSLPQMPESERLRLRTLFCPEKAPSGVQTRIYISYVKRDFPAGAIERIVEAVSREFGPASIFWDALVPPGQTGVDYLDRELKRADCVLFFIGPSWLKSKDARRDIDRAIRHGKWLVPILLAEKVSWAQVPDELRSFMGSQLRFSYLDADLGLLVSGLRSSAPLATSTLPPSDPDDPQKNRWGGLPERNGRRLAAEVKELAKTWFEIVLKVKAFSGDPLRGEVIFHLHDSFKPTGVRTAPVRQGVATLKLRAYGAFTVGAVADDGRTNLELDLATLPGAPKYFREH
jgi:MinD-like ATPase involved in chromosome partitioning or flagellar assembly